MIGKSFDPSSLANTDREWWNDWNIKAEIATLKAIGEFESWFARNDGATFTCEFRSDIWKELKEWYRDGIFHRKCAYCESRFTRYKGDAEHYRPKGSVKFKGANGKFPYATCDVPDPQQGGVPRTIIHPGYFWLAYDWRNLIPACPMCNSGQGKNDRFDVRKEFVVLQKLTAIEFAAMPEHAKPRPSIRWPDYYYPSPQMLDLREDPLLLNPLNPRLDPRKHIRFGICGVVTAIDESVYGQTSIEILQLSEANLETDRQGAQEDFQDKYYDKKRKLKAQDRARELSVFLEPYRGGAEPFSAAALDFHELLVKWDSQI
jgi:hypothetical protein